MESLLDIHTHRIPKTPGLAIENIRFPASFEPEPGRYYSLGIHPWDVDKFSETQVNWPLFRKWAAHPQVLAIGEAGMDKSVHQTLLLRQEQMFTCQTVIAAKVNKPVIMHNVRSTGIIRLCKEYSSSRHPWIQHGFRGNASAVAGAINHRFHLSFGPIYDEEALRTIPLERLFLETDDSGIDIHEVYRRAAETLAMPIDELIGVVQENIHRVFFRHEEL